MATHEITPIDVARIAFSSWNPEQLEEMAAIIDGLRASVGAAPKTEFQQQRLRGGGYIELKMINGCGPYQYLRYWHQGKRKSVYVGKVNGERARHELP